VLLPLSSTPTIDMRVVFRAGTADDPSDMPGAALVTAQTLNFDLRFLDDLVRFAAGGGTTTVDVGLDHTAFIARGLDMHLDYLLAGLRRLVREGRHDDPSSYATLSSRRAKKADPSGAFTDAWRAALYGDRHPYAYTGSRHTSTTLSLEDISEFRRRYYTPDNATLVISGRFDPALANRWIDFLFADWKGKAGP
jgi:zinc protease